MLIRRARTIRRSATNTAPAMPTMSTTPNTASAIIAAAAAPERAKPPAATPPAPAGAVARKTLGEGVVIRGAVIQIGDIAIDRAKWKWDECANNPFWCPDAET